MAVKAPPTSHHITSRDYFNAYPQVVVRWLCWLAIIMGMVGLLVAPVWAAPTPSPIVVDSQVKVEFSKFKFSRRSNTYNGKAELTNRSLEITGVRVKLNA